MTVTVEFTVTSSKVSPITIPPQNSENRLQTPPQRRGKYFTFHATTLKLLNINKQFKPLWDLLDSKLAQLKTELFLGARGFYNSLQIQLIS